MLSSVDRLLNEHRASTIVVVNYLVVATKSWTRSNLREKELFGFMIWGYSPLWQGWYSVESVSLLAHNFGDEGVKEMNPGAHQAFLFNSVSFLPLAHGTVLPRFRVGHTSSGKPPWKCLQRHSEACLLNPVTWTMEIDSPLSPGCSVSGLDRMCANHLFHQMWTLCQEGESLSTR